MTDVMKRKSRRFWQCLGGATLLGSGFIFGVGVGRMHLIASAEHWIRAVDQRWTILEAWFTRNPASLVILTTIVLGILSFLKKPFTRLIEPATMMDAIFEEESEISVVLPQIPGATFIAFGTQKPIVLPSNTPLLPFEDALAVELVAETVERRYRGNKKLVFDSEGGRASRRKSFISIGGPSVNAAALSLKQAMPWFTHDAEKEIFRWFDDEFRVLRGSDPGSVSPPVVVDYGFIFIAANPTTKVRSVFLWGGWAPGTYAAARVFLESDNTRVHRKAVQRLRSFFTRGHGKLMDQLRDSVHKNQCVVAIIEVTDIDLLGSNTEIVKVGTFDLKKPKPPRTWTQLR